MVFDWAWGCWNRVLMIDMYCVLSWEKGRGVLGGEWRVSWRDVDGMAWHLLTLFL